MYKLTAYDYQIIATPVDKDDPCKHYEWVREQKMRLDAELVPVLTLETEDKGVWMWLHSKRDEWRKQNLAYAVQVTDDEGHVRREQNMRDATLTPRYGNHPEWGMHQSRKRSWQQVEEFVTDYETIHFAMTGRDA